MNYIGVLLFALPYEIFFFTTWILYSIIRPIIVLSIILPLLFYPKSTIYNRYYYVYNSILYMILCKDKKLKVLKKQKSYQKQYETLLNDPAMYFPQYNNNTNHTNSDASDDTTTPTTTKIEAKTIIFVRHGESTWNDIFNKGNDRSTLQFVLNFIPNLVKHMMYEYYYYMSGNINLTESYLYDAPLSQKGIQQAQVVQNYLNHVDLQYTTPKEQKLLSILKNSNNNNETDTAFLVSNLRRAITTAAIAFYPHFVSEKNHTVTPSINDDDNNNNNDGNNNNLNTPTTSNTTTITAPKQLIVLSCLQEISCNPDALCITPSSSSSSSSSKSQSTTTLGRMVSSKSDPTYIQRTIYNSNSTMKKQQHAVIDTTHHFGNKSLSSTGLDRIYEFCSYLFHQNTYTESMKATTQSTTQIEMYSNYVVTGHSLWFLTFFQLLLPHHSTHIAKQKKLSNGSMIGFTLLHTTTTTTTNENDDKNKNGVVQHHYMIDPTSLVVLHGGF